MSTISGLDHPDSSILSHEGRLLSFLKYSNLHIVLVALGMMAGSSALAGFIPKTGSLVAGCCGAFLIYHADRCWLISVEDRKNQPRRVDWIASHQMYVWIAALIFVILGAIGVALLTVHSIVVGGILGLLGSIYLLPVLPGGVRPKSIWFVKPLCIALAWSAGAVIFPALEIPDMNPVLLAGLVFYRFLFVLPNVLLADWQDRVGDIDAGYVSVAMLVTEKQLRQSAGISALLALFVGLGIGLASGWPAILFIDLLGPLMMLLICTKPLSKSYLVYGLILDLVVAWPVVTAGLAQIHM